MRPPRQDYVGARHHVMNRGARHANIFFDAESRKLFLDTLAVLPDRFGVRIHGFALMPNHFHLMVESEGNLSRAIRHLCSRYVQTLNARRGWDGPLFRGRFRNKLVETDSYWRYLLLYLHLNPQRSGINGADAAWTSHRAYLGDDAPPWLTTSELMESYGSRSAYLEALEVAGENPSPPRGFDPGRLWAPTETGPLQKPRFPTAYGSNKALEDVVQVTAFTAGRVLAATPGPYGNPARWVLAWWMSRRAIGHGEIGQMLGVKHSNVTRMVQRVEHRRHSDPELRRWTAALEQAPGENGVDLTPPLRPAGPGPIEHRAGN